MVEVNVYTKWCMSVEYLGIINNYVGHYNQFLVGSVLLKYIYIGVSSYNHGHH